MTSCARHSDCGERHQCNYHGVCVCTINYGREGDDCMDFTLDCLWGIVFSFAGIVVGLFFLIWATRILARTVSCGHKGYFLSTSVVCLLSAMAASSLWANAFTHAIYPSYPSTARAWTLINNIHICANGTLLLLAALNLSLMWIEFIIASKRLLPVGRNLRLTASFLFWYMVSFVIAAIGGMVINSAFHRFGYSFWVLSTCLTVVMLIGLLTVGSVRMSNVLLREARRVSKIGKEMDSRAMAQQNLRLSARLRARAENIISCARQIRAACLCYIISIIGKLAADLMRAPTPINWILFAFINTSLCGTQWAIMSCIDTSMKIDQAHARCATTALACRSCALHAASQPESAGGTMKPPEPKRGGSTANDSEASGPLPLDQPRTQSSTGRSLTLTWSEELAAAPAALLV